MKVCTSLTTVSSLREPAGYRVAMRSFALLLPLLGCGQPASTPPVPSQPTPSFRDVRQVVPSAGLPPEVSPQVSNNNLDITWHDGRIFLAFRTAPTHFASSETVMYVVSSADEETWRFEGAFSQETDLREPRFAAIGGNLFLYFAILGDNALDFEPQGTVHYRYDGPGAWGPEEPWPDATFIPWRIKDIDGVLYLVGYTGGGGIYEPDAEPLEISLLRSSDGETWDPVVADTPVVQTGGGSETDFVFLDNGDLVAVSRNEQGDAWGYGSKICRAPASDLAQWDCASDPKKYDSPLLFRHGDDIWLVGRRNVTEDGHYDLGKTELSPEAQFFDYQVTYWSTPKRCALWRVDPEALSVTWELDLPSRGDTCFASILETDDGLVLYNYSSDPQGPDLSWLEGQTQPTFIHRMILELP